MNAPDVKSHTGQFYNKICRIWQPRRRSKNRWHLP